VDQDILQIVDSLSSLPQVLLAEPNYVYHLANIPPNDTYYSYQWGLHDPYGINIEGAWGITTGDPNVKIAILDSGIDMEHPDLHSKIVDAYDFVWNDDYPEDRSGHGTHIAGIAAASADNDEELNGESYIAGVSWGSPIVPLKVCLTPWDICPLDKMVAAIHQAVDTEGVRVINLSIAARSSSQSLETALNYAYVKNVTVVASSGNKNSSGPRYPAAHSTVIAVAATNQEGVRADFSNYGPHIDIAAPGVDIISTGPLGPISGGKGLLIGDGTSASAPLVSGVAALLYSVLPAGYQRPAVVKRILEATTVDVQPSGWDSMVGWGRLNAYQAVYEAANPPRLDFYAPLHWDSTDHSAWMTLKVRDIETQKILYEARIPQNSEGRPIEPPPLYGIPTGDYNVIIKAPASVTRLVDHVHLTAGSTAYVDFSEDGRPLYLEHGGDFNNDDKINEMDKNYMNSVYFTDNSKADLNGDGYVTAKDMTALIHNLGDTGDDFANSRDSAVNPTTTKVQAALGPASLSVSPNTGTYSVDQEFEAQIQVDTAGKSVDGVDLVLRYDPLALRVVEIIEGTVFPSSALQEVDWSMGEIIIGAHESQGASFSGTGTVATIRFLVIAGETPTTLRVRFRPADTTDSNLAEIDTNQEVLGEVGYGRYILVGTPERSEMEGYFGYQNGDYLTKMENTITFRPELSSKILVEAVTFDVYYDSEWHTLETDYNLLNGLRTYWHTELVTDQAIRLRARVLDLNDDTTTFTLDDLYLDRTAPTTILTTPTFLPEGGTFLVSWLGQDNLAGVDSYDVQYKDGEGSEWVIWQSETTATSATFTGESGHNYYFQVRARDEAGNEEAFSEEVAVLGDPPTVYLPLVVRN
jgi:hypothetical protein